MKVFLSWSGGQSRRIAEALQGLVKLVLPYVKLWSSRDIDAGQLWVIELLKNLHDSQYGIVCLTSDNLEAPWLLFEAGALSKTVDMSGVCPYLLDVQPQDIKGPLSHFQAKNAERSQTFEMLKAINHRASAPIAEQEIESVFDTVWPAFEPRLRSPSLLANDAESTQMDEVINVISTNLRPNFGAAFPNSRSAVLETLRETLEAASLIFEKERRNINPKGPHTADLFNSEYKTGITVRLCKSVRDIQNITGEIIAAVPRIGGGYKGVIFVIYDAGYACEKTFVVKDPARWDGVHLVVIRH